VALGIPARRFIGIRLNDCGRGPVIPTLKNSVPAEVWKEPY